MPPFIYGRRPSALVYIFTAIKKNTLTTTPGRLNCYHVPLSRGGYSPLNAPLSNHHPHRLRLGKFDLSSGFAGLRRFATGNVGTSTALTAPSNGAASGNACMNALLTGLGVSALTFVVAGDPVFEWEVEQEQKLVGLGMWITLAGMLAAGLSPLERAQTGIVIAYATVSEYIFSEWLEVYFYRIETVPPFVPPGHGMVYATSLLFGHLAKQCVPLRGQEVLIKATFALGALWSVSGSASDFLGLFWFICLAGFGYWNPQARLTYVGCWWLVSYIELLGTGSKTWVWRPDGLGVAHEQLSLFTTANPPSGVAGGYAWFDCAGIAFAPFVIRSGRNMLVSFCLAGLMVGGAIFASETLPKPKRSGGDRKEGIKSAAEKLFPY